jgi:hypothetical protein
MTTESASRTIYFELRYIVADFDFADARISVPIADNVMVLLIRKRTDSDPTPPPLEVGDGLATVSCAKQVSERLYTEAASSGRLSVKKEAVRLAQSEMRSYLLRMLRLIRWRSNAEGRPNPIRFSLHDGFRWSLDRNEWKSVADNIHLSASLKIHSRWTPEASEFLAAESASLLNEPLGHELLREAWTNRESNPRSSIVLAVAAAEVGFKRFATNVLPDTAWLLESLPSPPVVKMIKELFPWSRLNLQVSGVSFAPPASAIKTLEKAVMLRNNIVHGREDELERSTVVSIITAVRDLLYSFDFAQGQTWALSHLSAFARKDFPQIKSWPLTVTPLL